MTCVSKEAHRFPAILACTHLIATEGIEGSSIPSDSQYDRPLFPGRGIRYLISKASLCLGWHACVYMHCMASILPLSIIVKHCDSDVHGILNAMYYAIIHIVIPNTASNCHDALASRNCDACRCWSDMWLASTWSQRVAGPTLDKLR